jgi:hypothetical protein
MKRYLLFILLFISLGSNGQTSVYHPFPDSAAVWNINYYADCWIFGTAYANYSITISGDTLINSQTYHKLITPYILGGYTGSCGIAPFAGYRGAIRQDIPDKKVFYVPPTDSIEELLYDFNMELGDPVPGYINMYNTNTVQDIDSVLVGGSYRKRWQVSQQYSIYFIEGIGSTYGLLEFSPPATDHPGYTITCFQQDGQSLYPENTANCELITTLFDYDIVDEIKIFPNPSKGSFKIDIGNYEVKEIELKDLFGKTIQKPFIRTAANFELDNIQRGVYILTIIKQDNTRITRKLISY